MGAMSSTLYLPDEVLSLRNYPEAVGVSASIKSILTYMGTVASALQDYTSGTLDRINLTATDLQLYIGLCRDVCSTLGSAQNVCYDLLIDIRGIQDILQTLSFVKTRYGSQYIGVPTNGG